jgi:hypothetical protein
MGRRKNEGPSNLERAAERVANLPTPRRIYLGSRSPFPLAWPTVKDILAADWEEELPRRSV